MEKAAGDNRLLFRKEPVMKEKEYIEELKDKYGITEFGLPKELEGEEPDEVQEIFLSEGDLYDKNE